MFAAVFHLTAPATPALASPAPPAAAVQTVYYAGCREARAAGAAPLHHDEPGYRTEMDGDGDGVACEDYAGSGGSSGRSWFGGRRSRRR